MKENVFPSDFLNSKKQVRFNISKMSSPSDHQLPRPLKDIQNTNSNGKHNRENTGPSYYRDKSMESGSVIQDGVYLPPRKFDKDGIQTSRDFLLLPKPSDDLELSVLDCSEVFTDKNDDFQNRRDENAIGLGVKVYENDIPYCFPPTKMPLHSVHKETPSEKLFDLNPGLVSSAARSKKDFCLDKPDTDPALGFFTLPNSAGLYSEQKATSAPTNGVAFAKANIATQNSNFRTHLQRINDENIFSGPQNVLKPQPGPQKCPTLGFSNNISPKLTANAPSCVPQKQINVFNAPIHSGSHNLNPNRRFNEPVMPNLQRCNRNDRRSQTMQNNDFCNMQRCNVNRVQVCNCNENNYLNNLHDFRQNLQLQCGGHVCCNPNTQNCGQYLDSNQSKTVNNGLEMKQKAMEAREKQINGIDVLKEGVTQAAGGAVARTSTNNEPTVSDLYEIIKLQNQQLQMLQQRVDRLLTVNESNAMFQEQTKQQNRTTSDVGTNRNAAPQADGVKMNCIEHISIGVMTSFELVMSSNYVNKRSVTFNPQVDGDKQGDGCVQTTQNLTSSSNPERNDCGNFLDGITPCNKPRSASNTPLRDGVDAERVFVEEGVQTDCFTPKISSGNRLLRRPAHLKGNAPIPEYNEDLYNETENECSQPNIGWTFYNNVMNRVNNILHSPPSAGTSPNTSPSEATTARQNHGTATTGVNRVIPQPVSAFPPRQYEKPASELSLHMRQLACKYNIRPAAMRLPLPAPGDARNDLSLATMQYMQRYQLLSVSNEAQQQIGLGAANFVDYRPQHNLKPAYKNPSRILDITALKQQSKLL